MEYARTMVRCHSLNLRIDVVDKGMEKKMTLKEKKMEKKLEQEMKKEISFDFCFPDSSSLS